MNTVPTIFGQISPPPGPNIYGNPVEGLGLLLTFGIRMIITVGMIAVLIYLLWGAFDWITAGGDKDKIDSARSKMTNSILGILLMVIALGIFGVISGDVLGIIRRDGNGNWIFGLPRIGPASAPPGSCGAVGQACPCCAGLTCTGGVCIP